MTYENRVFHAVVRIAKRTGIVNCHGNYPVRIKRSGKQVFKFPTITVPNGLGPIHGQQQNKIIFELSIIAV